MINFKTKVIAIVLVVSVVVAAGIYFGFKNFYFSRAPAEISGEPAQKIQSPSEIAKPESPKPSLSELKSPALTLKTETTFPGYKLYKNAEFGFEIQYPESFIITEEINENVRGEMVKEFYFKKPGSDLRFAILPRDGLSYGLPSGGTSEDINIGGFPGVQTKYVTADGRRLLLVHPQVNIFNWDQDIGRLDIESSIENPIGDFEIFNKMLNSFKLVN